MNKQTVGNNLKSRRVKLGMSRQDLAYATGISMDSISGYEQGKTMMSLDKACRLAEAMGCKVSDLTDEG